MKQETLVASENVRLTARSVYDDDWLCEQGDQLVRKAVIKEMWPLMEKYGWYHVSYERTSPLGDMLADIYGYDDDDDFRHGDPVGYLAAKKLVRLFARPFSN